jgi:hypothetical protein
VERGEVRVSVVLERAKRHRRVARLEREDDAHEVLEALQLGGDRRDPFARHRRREPDLGLELACERTQLGHFVPGGAREVEALDDHETGLRARLALELHGFAELRRAEAARRIGTDAAAAVDLGALSRRVLELRRRRELLEHGVVERPDVAHGLVERHVQDMPAAEQIVERDAHQAGRLADAVSREDQPQVPLAEPAVKTLFEKSERAPGVQELAVHAAPIPRPSA